MVQVAVVVFAATVVVFASRRTVRARVDEMLQGCFYPPSRPPKTRRDDDEAQCQRCFASGDGRSFTYSKTLCDNCQPDGTTCGTCDAFTFTDENGNCEECGESKL